MVVERRRACPADPTISAPFDEVLSSRQDGEPDAYADCKALPSPSHL